MMMNVSEADVTIREATKQDLPQLFELYRELQPDDPPIDERVATAVYEKAIERGVTYFVAEHNGTIVATSYVAIIPNITRRYSPIGFVENMVTSTAYRRRGIGKKLLEMAVKYAREQGCYKVTLQSGVKRTEAHSLYESAGFDGSSKRAFEIRF